MKKNGDFVYEHNSIDYPVTEIRRYDTLKGLEFASGRFSQNDIYNMCVYEKTESFATLSISDFHLFSTLRNGQSEFRNRIIMIKSDCNLLNLGKYTIDRTTLIQGLMRK